MLNPESALSDGGAGSGLLHRADLSGPVPLRRMPDRAPLEFSPGTPRPGYWALLDLYVGVGFSGAVAVPAY